MTVQIQENAFEVGFIEDLFVFSKAQQQGRATDIVDLAGDAFGVVKETSRETVTEELALIASDPEMVFDVSGGFFQVEGGELIADGDPLMEGAIGSEAKFVSQVGLAQQDEGEVGSGVEVIIEQEAQLVKEVRGELVSFIDDEQDEAPFASELLEGVAELGLETAEGISRFNFESQQDLSIEAGRIEVGIGQVDEGMEVAVKRVSKGAQGGRFAGANVAGDQGRQAFLERKSQTALNFLMPSSGEEILGGNRAAEGGLTEAIILIEGGH